MSLARRISPRLPAIILLGLLLMVAADGRSDRSEPATLLVGVHAGSEETLAPLLAASGARITARLPELNLLVVETAPGRAEGTVHRLRQTAAVRYVEHDQPLTLAAEPNDPLYMDGKQWNLTRIRAAEAWDLIPGDGKTIVAVLDSGVDHTHPDLAGQVVPRGCEAFAAGCTTGTAAPLDTIGHGTHVAGIIGAKTNNALGVASVTGGRVSILAVRLSARATSTVNGADALRAVVYAVDNGAKVINMSFGGRCGTPQSDPWREAVDYAHNRDVLIVVSAGNDGECVEGRYPASDPRVLAVAAVDREGFQPSFSSRGPYVSVAAPGVSIHSTYLNGGYATVSGTSMAAPHVSGLAALLYQVPGATAAKVMEWIKSTCDGLVDGNQCGGVINAYRAAHLAAKGVDPGKVQDAPPPPAGEPPSPVGEPPAAPMPPPTS